MLFRSSVRAMLLLFCLNFCGCYTGNENSSDEQKNPYFLAGKERVSERDWKGAIEAFEKALELSPHSARIHFELAVAYDTHGNQKEDDYVAAMYHYYQAIKLRPNEHPADNARERISACKSELVKAESLAPPLQSLARERDKLRDENQLLRQQLDALQSAPPGRATTQRATDRTSPAIPPGNAVARVSNAPPSMTRTSPAPYSISRITPLPPTTPAARSHTVKERETAFSIARQYHVKLEALLSANPSLDPKRLRAGQVLRIPST